MEIIVMLFSLLITSSLWGMEITKQPDSLITNSFIAALKDRMNSDDPIVLHFQNVKDDASELAMLKTVRKGIQVVAKKTDSNLMVSPLSRLSMRRLSDEAKKNYGDEINNGWIALCVGITQPNGGLFNVQKYCLSSQKWEFGQEIDCTLPQGYTYKDLEESDMVVVNIPAGDDDSIGSCFTLIRSLREKNIPLLVNSDRRLLQDVWDSLGDLFPQTEDVHVFSNYLLADDGSDSYDVAESSDSENLFDYFCFTQLEDKAVGEIVQDDHDDNKKYSQQVVLKKEEDVKKVGDTLQGDASKNSEKSLEEVFTETFSTGIQQIKTNIENKKKISSLSGLHDFLKNPWVISGASVALISFLWYYKFVC